MAKYMAVMDDEYVSSWKFRANDDDHAIRRTMRWVKSKRFTGTTPILKIRLTVHHIEPNTPMQPADWWPDKFDGHKTAFHTDVIKVRNATYFSEGDA